MQLKITSNFSQSLSFSGLIVHLCKQSQRTSFLLSEHTAAAGICMHCVIYHIIKLLSIFHNASLTF